MTKTALLFFILLGLVAIQAYSAVPETPSPSREYLPAEIQDVVPKEALPLITETPASRYLGITLESYQPLGQGAFQDLSTANLANVGSTLLPSLHYGRFSNSDTLGEFQTTYGLEASVSFTSQDAALVSTSGLSGSGRFQTTIFSARPLMRFHWRTKKKIFTRIFADAGFEQVNWVSNGSLSSFSHGAGYIGYGVGVEWDPSSQYGIVLDYSSRTAMSAEQAGWSASGTNYQLGGLYFF